MAKSTACKFCILFFVVLLAVGGGILAWQLVGQDDNDSSKKGVFGGFFGEKNETTTAPITIAPTTPPMPTASPSATPTEYQYPFHQCSPGATTCCNGLENLCDWPVNEVMFGALHNAMATEDKFLVPNHLRPVEEALQAGFRAINVDICNCQGVFQLCHGFCGLGEADPLALFKNLTTFLQKNEKEVLIVTMQLNSKAGQPVDLKTFYDDVWMQSGLSEFIYFHPDTEEPWPTLGTMIENNERLIAFHYNGPECLEEGDCPNTGIHWYWRYAQETQFDFAAIEDILDSETSCPIARGRSSTTGTFFGVNNFITSSSLTLDLDGQLQAADTANSLDFANQRIQKCSELVDGTHVNLLYVDFWSKGDIVQVVQEFNRDLGEYN